MSRTGRICFTDSAGKAIFSIPDGGFLRLSYGNGDENFALCHRLDETHAEIDGVRQPLKGFAQKMEQNKISYAPA